MLVEEQISFRQERARGLKLEILSGPAEGPAIAVPGARRAVSLLSWPRCSSRRHGLGKTIQAIAAAELLRQRRGIQRVLVVAPASVKYPPRCADLNDVRVLL